MLTQEFTRDEFTLSTDRSKLDINIISGFLSRSHWAKNRSRDVIVKSIANSLCYGVYHHNRQVAFSRLVTDYATYAYLCDVYVDEEYRGRGLSKWMMECVMGNPDLAQLRRFTLATKSAHGLYEKFGFRRLAGDELGRFMSILKENV